MVEVEKDWGGIEAMNQKSKESYEGNGLNH